MSNITNNLFNITNKSNSSPFKIEYDTYIELQQTYQQFCYFIGRFHKSNRQTTRTFINKYNHIKYTIFSCLDIDCQDKIHYISNEDEKIIKWPHIYKDFPFPRETVNKIEQIIKININNKFIYHCISIFRTLNNNNESKQKLLLYILIQCVLSTL